MASEIKLYNMDCMEAMKQMPDKSFDLAIVDPPYGGGATQGSEDVLKNMNILRGGQNKAWEQKDRSRFGGRFDKYRIEAERTGVTWAEKYGSNIKHWDIAPNKEYFDELARVSKNQIIWGGNYFSLPATRCFLVWRKLTISEKFTMAMCEYAWTSFNDNAKWIEIAPQDSQRFHPTQKPVKLYAWVLKNYAKKGDKILDTHLGSGSQAIACYDMGFDLTGFEINKGYYEAAIKRLENHKKQQTLF